MNDEPFSRRHPRHPSDDPADLPDFRLFRMEDVMAEHLLFSEHLTAADFDCPIRNTYLGQAHIAGTGPEGTTCRQCLHWGKKKFVKDTFGNYVEKTEHPKRYGSKHKKWPGEPKDAHCLKPIINKAKRLIPHHALSCRLFEASEHPMPVTTGKDA